ncbi:SHOCT domain-containing protein [Microbacterium sp. NPDC057659]|uniref:SHOCT domain-containing protein n=1 Tax=unclassified Microbacterium TaxID=2609290 RepID=UPI0018E014BD|nr:hypothetical protein [Microbacterium sp. MAH-37]MDR2997138.1 hypothetical protein [Microbacterium sp.]
MLATSAAVAAHAGVWGGAPFWPFFFIGPVMFLIIVGLLITLIVRRRRYWGGPWQAAPGGHAPWAQAQGRSAEQILADRFAKGDVDETEYRARLEVLRANRPEA